MAHRQPQRRFFCLGAAIPVAFCLSLAAAPVQSQTDVGASTCDLFLHLAGTNPVDYNLYESWLRGFLAAHAPSPWPDSTPGVTDVAGIMSGVLGYCHAHANETFDMATEFVVTSKMVKKPK